MLHDSALYKFMTDIDQLPLLEMKFGQTAPSQPLYISHQHIQQTGIAKEVDLDGPGLIPVVEIHNLGLNSACAVLLKMVSSSGDSYPQKGASSNDVLSSLQYFSKCLVLWMD